MTRIFFATDAHGSERTFLKFVGAAKFYKANVLILGGDLTGKLLVPIVKQANGTFRAQFLGSEHSAETVESANELEKRIRLLGYYPYYTDMQEMKELNADPKKVEELFTRLMVESLERWVQIAEEHLKNSGIKCFLMPGNDDRLEIDDVLRKSDYVVNPEGQVVWIDDKHEMISTGYSNMTPWKCPRDIPDEDLSKKIEGMATKVSAMESCIFNFHCPPHDSGLDTAPKLDKDLKPIVTSGMMLTGPAGSLAVRAAIEKYQPLLGLHGHIHESRGTRKIGRALCINPGSEYSEGILRGALVNTDEKGVKSYLLTSG